MESVFTQTYDIKDNMVDCQGYLKPSQILFIAQDMGGRHCKELTLSYDDMAARGLFWAVSRHRVQITRLPMSGETIRVETWAMPATAAAYPRSVVAYDEKGKECFRSITLWVIMTLDTRKMLSPSKSGIQVAGITRGLELSSPKGLVPRNMVNSSPRRVCYTDIDRNGHMNNARYMEWVDDLFPSAFHREHRLKELLVCYLAESREGQTLDMHYGTEEDGCVRVDAYRKEGTEDHRVFSARMLFE